MNIEEILKKEEGQSFDKKSINIEPKSLANTIVAFANADGGLIVLGISDKTSRIEGIDFENKKLNEILRVPFDFCTPTVKVQFQKIPCKDFKDRDNHVLLLHIDASSQVHTNQADEVFLRVGDKSKKQTFEERLQLSYDKGDRYFEDKAVLGASLEDINMNLVQDYINRINYSKSPLEYLSQNKGFVKESNGKIQISSAAILLFGKNPQDFFPRARIRFIKYDGTTELFGSEMNVIKDVIFEGTILKVINDSVNYLSAQIKERTYLGKDGIFVTEEEYPKFVRQELIVNAVTHRAYDIIGTEIQIKMFDDKLIVESPGKLPGLVKTDNIRHTHFSRNPKIAEYLKVYNFVKEYGEGVDRMCVELDKIGLEAPIYKMDAFILKIFIYSQNLAIEDENRAIEDENRAIEDENRAIEKILALINQKKYNKSTKENILNIYKEIGTKNIFSTKDIERIINSSPSVARKIMAKMRDLEILEEVKGYGKGKYIIKQ